MTGTGRFGPFGVRWAGPGLDAPVRELLGRDVGAAGDAHRPEIALEALPDPGPIGTPTGADDFFVGALRGFVGRGSVVLSDGLSRIEIDPETARVSLAMSERSFAAEPGMWAYALPAALSVVARAHGVFHMHSALAELGGVPLLVTGEARAGKSTTALALVAAGARWATDDLCLFEPAGEVVHVWGVPRPFHLRERTAELFPEVAALGTARTVAGAPRVDVDPAVAWPDRRMALPVIPAAIVLPAVTDDERTRAEEGDRAAAVGELLHASAMIGAEGLGRQREQMDALAALVAPARVVSLRLGRDALADPLLPARVLGRFLGDE